MSKVRLVAGGFLGTLMVAAIVGGAVFFGSDQNARDQLLSQIQRTTQTGGNERTVSGFIEAEEIDLATEMGGRVVALPYEEGDEISAGDMLLRLDTGLLDAQQNAVEARLSIAEAERDLLAVGARPEVLAQAEAQVRIAQASVNAARTALNAMVTLRNNPQDLRVQLVEAQAQVEAAQHQVNAANTQLQIAERGKQTFETTYNDIQDLEEKYGENGPDLWVPLELALAPQRYSAAQDQLTAAQSTLDSTRGLLDTIEGLVNNPQALQARVVETQATLGQAQAALEQAQARLDDLRAGPTDQQLNAAAARVGEAQAALDALTARIRRMQITAPANGVILEQSIHVGELAAPGVPVITLANLDVVEMTIYITADRLDRVALNEPVRIRVDSFPRETFEGTIVYIADEAEFTPRNVQTEEERVNLVYAVKIRIENPDHALKPGMPADAVIGS